MSVDTSPRRSRPTITPELLRELIDYDPETGVLTWKVRGAHHFRDGVLSAAGAASIWNAQHAGKPALAVHKPKGGYRSGWILGRQMAAHRAAWAIVHDRMPSRSVAHLDGDPTNNRIDNLRDGIRGKQRGASNVLSQHNRWHASVTFDGRREYLGSFRNRDDALAASRAADARNGFKVAGASR